MLDLRDCRVAYGPCNMSLDAPGDRRRFCYYAAKRKIRFEIAQLGESYDVVVLTQGADISIWRRHPQGRTKIIFDFPDAYLAIPPLDPKGLLRGLAKFVAGQNRRWLWNYTKGLQEMCARADAVVCAAEEQAQRALPFCANVHAILDFQGASIRDYKYDYAAGEVFNLVWEGLPFNLRFLREIQDVLRDLARKHKLAVHIITAMRYGKYLNGKVGQRRTEDEARTIFRPLYLYEWNEETISAISCACDLAIIPIPLDEPLCAGKPENKLLFFWRMGVPAIVSATPAHVRTMGRSGLAMACEGADEWSATLEHYVSDEHARREAGARGKEFAERYYGENKLIEQWDSVFESVLDETIKKPAIECLRQYT